MAFAGVQMSPSPQAVGCKSDGFLQNADSRAVQFERWTSKWLREDIGELVAGGNWNHLQISDLGLSADKVMLHFNVLGAIEEFRIVHHSNSALVVSMKWSWAGWTEVEVT